MSGGKIFTTLLLFLFLLAPACGAGTIGPGGNDDCPLGEDCGSPSDCGNGDCEAEEDCSSCQADCGTCPGTCGDGHCGEEEDCSNCEPDCGVCRSECGNDECELDEDCSSCDADCGECPETCGDGDCTEGEDCGVCTVDCGTICFACVDADGDGRGLDCQAGLDCDDQNPLAWDNCTITLAWDAPTTNTDGSLLDDLMGYRVYFGSSPGGYASSEDASSATCQPVNDVVTCSFPIGGFTAGTVYFAVTALTTAGSESVLSNEVSHTFE